MDNDNKIVPSGSDKANRNLEKSKQQFLKSKLKDSKENRFYNLEDEFQKSKKNRNWWIVGVIAILIIITGVTTVLLSREISKASERAQVDIGDFNDINLQDVLDRAKRLENDLRLAMEERKRVDDNWKLDIEKSQNRENRDIEVIETTQTSAAVKNQQVNQRRQQGAQERETLNQKYQAQLATLDQEIAAIQDDLDQYDSQKLNQARKQEEILDNKERVFQIEMEQTVKQYEEQINQLKNENAEEVQSLKNHYEEMMALLKANSRRDQQALTRSYNPQLTDEQILAITKRHPVTQKDLNLSRSFSNSPIPKLDYLADRSLLTLEEQQEWNRSYQDTALLLDRMDKIPFINGVPPLITGTAAETAALREKQKAFLERTQDLVRHLDTTLAEKEQSLAAEQALNEQFYDALAYQLRVRRESGYVITASPEGDVLILLDELAQLIPGDTAIVFRDDDQFIGKLKLKDKYGKLYQAEILELTDPNQPMKPLDKILVDIQGAAEAPQEERNENDE